MPTWSSPLPLDPYPEICTNPSSNFKFILKLSMQVNILTRNMGMIKSGTKAWSYKHQSSFLSDLWLLPFTAQILVELFIWITTMKVSTALQDSANIYLEGTDSPYESTVMFCSILTVSFFQFLSSLHNFEIRFCWLQTVLLSHWTTVNGKIIKREF